ncbi:MAG: Fic family protein [bacterium]
MLKLTKRQENILNVIRQNKKANNREIRQYLEKEREDVSRITIIRDLDILLKNNLLVKKGRGRNVYYEEKVKNRMLAFYDPEKYFEKNPDQREIKKSFNFSIFENLKNIFTENEIKELKKLNEAYLKRIKKLSPTLLKKEFERLTIELSWKSSAIEGNTYNLLDTEILIKENKAAKGHKKEEAIMILNHKRALDYIRDKKSDFKKLSLGKIENIHSLIINDLSVKKGLRDKPVGIIGTNYKPLDIKYQVKEVMENMIKVIDKAKDPFTKALIVLLMISYVQPFEDGNKRTARLLADAILLAYDICPISYRSIDEAEYKKAIILFYEQNSAHYLKKLFVEQYKFAISNYFGI